MDTTGSSSKGNATSYSDFYKNSAKTPGSSLSDSIASPNDDTENKRMAAIRRRLKVKRGVK